MKFLQSLAALVCLASMLAADTKISLDAATPNPPPPKKGAGGNLLEQGHIWSPSGTTVFGRAMLLTTDQITQLWATMGGTDLAGPTWYCYLNVTPGQYRCYGRAQYVDSTGKITRLDSNKTDVEVK
jgi:hypothetical protein